MSIKEGFNLNYVNYLYSDIETWDIQKIKNILIEIQETQAKMSLFIKDGKDNLLPDYKGVVPPIERYRGTVHAKAQLELARQRVSDIRKEKEAQLARDKREKRSKTIGDYYMIAAYKTLSPEVYEGLLEKARRMQSEAEPDD